jgi:hypothetical protein
MVLRFLLASFALAACHDGSSGPLPGSPASEVNLGLAAQRFFGAGDAWLLVVPEPGQGADLNRDGDLHDDVVFWLDAVSGSARNTGLVLERPNVVGVVLPVILASGSTFALGAVEADMGATDLNGDGDALDTVLALVDPASGARTDLGLAVSRIELAGEVVAIDVPELAQGQDLDGDGRVDPVAVVPHFHDLRTGETWSSGLRGTRILAADSERVALAELEAAVGDRNGDGDTLDLVLAFYELATRTHASTGLAIPSPSSHVHIPQPHGGRWAVFVSELSQGLGDLSGDGLPNGVAVFVVDPSTGDERNLPGLWPVPSEAVPFVLLENASRPWTYDAGADRLERTRWVCEELLSFDDQLVFLVMEGPQDEDLDHNGVRNGRVPVVFDPITKSVRNVALDGRTQRIDGRLWILSDEAHALGDWNEDGDRRDLVLHVWDESTSQLENTRIAVGGGSLSRCTASAATFLIAEHQDQVDLNGDADLTDWVAHVYDATDRSVTNLGHAAEFLPDAGGTSRHGFLLVSEDGDGRDLNGDGDRQDHVLHLVTP